MGTKAARTYGAATLAVGTAVSVCLATAPAASAADTTRTDRPAAAANVGAGLRDALDRARGLFTFNDGDVAGAVSDAQNTAQKLREQAQNALRDADVAKKLNLANDNVVALTDFVDELNAHAETLNSVLVSMPDAPKDADTLDTVTLTMTTRDGQVGVKTLNNVPRDAAVTLRDALEGAVDSVNDDTAVTTTKSPIPKPSTLKAAPTSTQKTEPTSKPEAPAATTTQRDTDNTGTDADLNASIDELRRIAAAIEAAKTNNPQAIEEMLARLADPSRGASSADINTVTGKNVNTVQNVSANTGSTSVAINIDPDGGLSISAAQGTDGAGGTAQPEKDTAKDADAVIAALDNLAAALRGEDAAPKGDGAGTDADTDNTDTAVPTSTMTEDEAAQHDRLRRALLALTSPEREANSPASRERDALIMIAQALKDGKDINLEELTTEQMLQVMDWLQNGIPEQALPDATATAEPTATSTATEPTATESSTVTTTTQSSTAPSQTGVVTVTETASPTTTTTTSKKKDKDSDEADETEEASKELASAINGLAKGLADRHSTAVTTTTPSTDRDDRKRDGTNAAEVRKVNTTSTTRVPAKKQGSGNNASGGGSGSSSNGSGSNSGSASNSNGNAAQSNSTGGSAATETATATAAPAAENTDADTMQAEAVSEELAVTGNSTQRMLMLLTLLGGVAAAALFVAMRRTRAE